MLESAIYLVQVLWNLFLAGLLLLGIVLVFVIVGAVISSAVNGGRRYAVAQRRFQRQRDRVENRLGRDREH